MADDLTFGERLRMRRERTGKTRAVLGGLVGRSEEWVKALENNRILMPRLPMLLALADALYVRDLADLTGQQSIPVASITKAGHEATPAVAGAMNRPVRAADAEVSVPALTARVDQAWGVWHQSANERTALAAVLPDLLVDARTAARSLDGDARRRTLVELARVYHLTQLFFAFQPASELVWLAADRAMRAAEDADDPAAIAAAAWYYSHVYRSNAQPDAAEAVAIDALTLLDPDTGTEQRARWGQLHLAAALANAKTGRAGHAWRHWDQADEAAGTLGQAYVHPWLMFGRSAVDAYGVTIETDLVRAGEAIRRADRVNVEAMPSRTRRAAFLLEAARAHSLRREYVATVHMMSRALRESVDTVRHSIFARTVTLDLVDRQTSVRGEARELAAAMGLLA